MEKLKSIDWKGLLEKAKEIDPNDINDIDWENMGSWPFPGKVFFLVLCFIAVLVGGYFALVDDVRARVAVEERKEMTLRKDFENKAFRGANLEAYKDQMVEMQDAFGSLLKQLPRDTEVPGLVDDISSAALGAGLALSAIDPGELTRTEFYNELPIDIEVVGGYGEMGAFVSAVASLPRIVTLHDFSIESVGQTGDLKMKIVAKTYQYNSDEG